MSDKSGLPDGQEFFKLNEVCKLANVQPYMLRFWGSEFTELEASRSDTGQRLYTRDQVEVILEIRRLLFDEGLTIAGTRKRVNALREGAKAAAGKLPPAATDAHAAAASAAGDESEAAEIAAAAEEGPAPIALPLPFDGAVASAAAAPDAAGATVPATIAETRPTTTKLPPASPEVDKSAPDRVQPLLAALKEVRSEVSRIVAEIRQTVGERP